MIVFHSENGENQNQNQMNDAFELIEALGKRIKLFFIFRVVTRFLSKSYNKSIYITFQFFKIFLFDYFFWVDKSRIMKK